MSETMRALKNRHEDELQTLADRQKGEIDKLNRYRERCIDCDGQFFYLADGLCRSCWAAIVVEYGGNPIAAYLPGFGS